MMDGSHRGGVELMSRMHDNGSKEQWSFSAVTSHMSYSRGVFVGAAKFVSFPHLGLGVSEARLGSRSGMWSRRSACPRSLACGPSSIPHRLDSTQLARATETIRVR